MSRRLVYAEISYESLADAIGLKPPIKIVRVLEEVRHDLYSPNRFVVWLEGDTFREINEGAVMPRVTLQITKKKLEIVA